MNLKIYILISLAYIIVGCSTCSNEKTKMAQWATTIDGSNIPSGALVLAQLKFIDSEQPIDSLVYRLNGSRIFATAVLTETLKMKSDTMKMGAYTITATIYRNNKKEEHIANMTILSDITPLQLKRKIGVVYPHSNLNFTEGLFFNNGMLYESTGMNGTSFICRYKLGSTTPEKLTQLPSEYFGEGSMLYDNKLIQLTWKNGVGIVYDAATLKKINEFKIGGEGWGLTYDGTSLIMSDGSHRLFYLDKESYAVTKILEVYDNLGKVLNMNELEYVNGVIYANVWMTDNIIKIDAKNGKVLAIINCEGLLTETEIEQNKCDVLNGIAYDDQTKKLYITGKNWPKIFELKL